MSNFQTLIPNANLTSLTIGAASATYTFDVDTYNFKGTPVGISISSTFAATSASSGILLYMYDGPGNSDNTHYSSGLPIVLDGSSVPTYGTAPITYNLTPPTLNAVAPQTVTTSVEILCYLVQRWVRFTLLNLDPANPAVITVVGDIP